MNYANEENRNIARIAIGIGLAVVLIAGGWWYWQRSSTKAPDEPAVAAMPEAGEPASADAPPAIVHPLQPLAEAPTEAAPTDPDQAAEATLGELFAGRLAQWLITDQLARRLVASVDNLPRNGTSFEKVRPLRAPDTPFAVEREVLDAVDGTERIVIADANFARYDSLVSLLARTDAAAIAAAYRRIYPQLQAGYEELGYPGRYFNDRVVGVIDHLLATPEPNGPLLLEQPKVLYRYADPALEALSPGQKLLLRMGNAHARAVKQKLREIRTQITRQPEEQQQEE